MIGSQVTDLIQTSQQQIDAANIVTIDDVRAQAEALIRFSDEMFAQSRLMKKFLRENLYFHHQVYRMTRKAHQITEALFETFINDEKLLPPEHQVYATKAKKSENKSDYARVVADYVAGMTDRFAIKEYDRLFNMSNQLL